MIHLIFSTQGRRPLIKPDVRNDLFAYLGGIIREMHATALIINGTADHVHMLVRRLRREFPRTPVRVPNHLSS